MNKLLKPREKQNLLFYRMRKIKPQLPKDWRKRLVAKNPEYNSLETADFVRRVHSLRASDETLTTILEGIAEEYQAELSAENLSIEKLKRRQKLVKC